MPEVTIGDQTVVIERFTLAKAMRVITVLSKIQKAVPDITKAMAEFKRDYGNENVEELDRVQAKLRFGPRPVVGEDGEPIMRKDPDGNPTGDILTLPSPIDRMTEADWERSGQALRLRQEPSNAELLTAIFPLVYEVAEEYVVKLLALVTMTNADVLRYVRSGELWDRVDERAQELIEPATLDEVMELAVTAAEQVEDQVMTKAKGLGDRVGKLARQFRRQTTIDTPTTPTSSEQPEPQSSDSASRSLSDGDGPTPTPSSDSPGTSSSASEMSLTPSA